MEEPPTPRESTVGCIVECVGCIKTTRGVRQSAPQPSSGVAHTAAALTPAPSLPHTRSATTRCCHVQRYAARRSPSPKGAASLSTSVVSRQSTRTVTLKRVCAGEDTVGGSTPDDERVVRRPHPRAGSARTCPGCPYDRGEAGSGTRRLCAGRRLFSQHGAAAQRRSVHWATAGCTTYSYSPWSAAVCSSACRHSH